MIISEFLELLSFDLLYTSIFGNQNPDSRTDENGLNANSDSEKIETENIGDNVNSENIDSIPRAEIKSDINATNEFNVKTVKVAHGHKSENQDIPNECIPRRLFKKIIELFIQMLSSISPDQCRAIDDRAAELWAIMNREGNECRNNIPHWWRMKAWQKLPYYWAALSNEVLSSNPYENFIRFYLGNCKSKNKHCNLTLHLWSGMSTKQKLPFIMEAFINMLGNGIVDINDEHEIHHVINRLINRY